MRSIRQLILERHRGQQAKLDQLREDVIERELQRRTGILPVTERTAMVAPDVAHNATTEVRGSGPRKPAVAADARTGVTFVRADARGDRLEARSAILDVFRHWLSLPRLGWSALTAAWLAIIGLNLATHSEAGSKPSAAARLETRELIQGLKEYRAQLAQLMHETSPDPDKEPAANPGKTPGPRGDAERIWRDARLHTFALS